MTAQEKFKPTPEIAEQAAKGRELREKLKRGGNADRRSERLRPEEPARSHLETLKRMKSYFAPHKVDECAKNFGDDDNPSAGHIARLLWAGEAGRDWVKKELQ